MSGAKKNFYKKNPEENIHIKAIQNPNLKLKIKLNLVPADNYLNH